MATTRPNPPEGSIKPKPVRPVMDPKDLVAVMASLGQKIKPAQAVVLIAAANGSIDKLEEILQLPIREMQAAQESIPGPPVAKRGAKQKPVKPPGPAAWKVELVGAIWLLCVSPLLWIVGEWWFGKIATVVMSVHN